MIRRWVAAYRLHGNASLRRKRAEYSSVFKMSVLQHMWDNGLSKNQAAAVFNIPNATTIRIWENRYRDGGSAALARVKTSTPEMPVPKPPPPSLPNQELTREQLLERVQYLEMEVVVLKKLETLTQTKKALALKKRK
jgi:transposase